MNPWAHIEVLRVQANAVADGLRVAIWETLGERASRTIEVDGYGRWTFVHKGTLHAARSPERLKEIARELAK